MKTLYLRQGSNTSSERGLVGVHEISLVFSPTFFRRTRIHRSRNPFEAAVYAKTFCENAYSTGSGPGVDFQRPKDLAKILTSCH